MPELPEVETVLRTLETQIKGEEILGVDVRLPKMIDRSPKEFEQKLLHHTFRTFSRRGKYLLFGMGDLTLVSHLRMEGKYFIEPDDAPVRKHTHVIFQLKGHRQLRYNDTRQFGTMELVEGELDYRHFHGLGKEPFDITCTGDYLYEIAHSRSIPIKTLLLDQSVIAGIGNIYADEICFDNRIRPGVSCARLSRKQCEGIVQSTKTILSEAIRCGGTTIRSYTSSLGVTGLFQLQCQIHSQKHCGVCGTPAKTRRIGGRTTYYCPNCQNSR